MKLLKGFSFLVACLVFLSGCNQSKEEMLVEGRELMASGNTNGAIVALRSALEKDPNYYEARYELAKAYIEAKKFDKAEKELEKVSRQNPANGELVLKKAEIYLATERVPEAVGELQSYLASHPQDVDALVLLGEAHAAANQWSDSSGAFRLALEVAPDSVEANFGLARTLLLQDNSEVAEDLFRKVIDLDPDHKRARYFLAEIEQHKGNISQALNLWESVIAISPGDITARYRAGVLHLGLGNLDEADDHGRFLLEKYPRRPEGTQLAGMVHFHRGNFEQAALKLSDSLNHGPNLQGHFLLGMAYFRQQKFDLALNHFNKALDLNPEFYRARLMLAATLLQLKLPGDAATHARRVVQGQPKDPHARNVLGTALLADGQVEAAMIEFERAVELDPRLSNVHLKKGLVELGRGKLDDAEAAMVQAVASEPQAIGHRIFLAGYYFRLGKTKEALAVLEEGRSGERQDSLLLNQKAVIYLSLNEIDKAISALKEASAVAPDIPLPHESLATIYIQTGEFDKALEHYDRILEIAPENLEMRLRRAAILEYSGNKKKALQAYREAAKDEEPSAVLALANFWIRKNDKGTALEILLENLKEANSKSPSLLEATTRLLLQEDRLDEAREYIDTLVDVNPDRGYPLLVASLVQTGQVDRALQTAKKVVTLYPLKVGGYLLLSDVYLYQKDFEAALAALNQSDLTIEKQNMLGLKRAQLLIGMGRLNDADSVYDRILETEPESTQALYAKGALMGSRGERKQSEAFYKKALQADPQNIPAWNNLAYIQLEDGGDPEEGLQYALRAYRLAPSNPAILDTLGFALYKTGRYEKARKLLEAAVQGLPDNPTVNYHLALAYLKLNEKQKAVGQLQLANAKDSFPEKQEVQNLLEKLQVD